MMCFQQILSCHVILLASICLAYLLRLFIHLKIYFFTHLLNRSNMVCLWLFSFEFFGSQLYVEFICFSFPFDGHKRYQSYFYVFYLLGLSSASLEIADSGSGLSGKPSFPTIFPVVCMNHDFDFPRLCFLSNDVTFIPSSFLFNNIEISRFK